MNSPRALRVFRWFAFAPVLPALLQAHPGHGAGNDLATGLVHPLSGCDHLLAMVAVGLWAAQLGGRARWALPAAFLAALATGAAVAAGGVTVPMTEALILGSVPALGVLIFGVVRWPLAVAAGVVAVFAFFHGLAHGAELPAGSGGWGYGAGFVLASAGLHLAGLAAGSWAQRFPAVALRFCGGSVALAGLGLLLT